MITEFMRFSLTPMVIGILAAVACALPGNFLILRRQALIGDAISHVVLPGIVVAFLLTGSVAGGVMMAGAAAAAVIAVALIEFLRRFGRIEPGAAMGVVFTTLFAAGVLMLEQSNTSAVHLDVEHALMGNLEGLVWLRATGWTSLFDADALRTLPPELGRMAAVCAAVVVMMALFWRWLVICTFDAGFARAVGIPAGAVGFGLVITTAAVAVAAFDAVGSIIVIAMFVCPPAAARLMTNSLPRQIAWSVGFATLSAVLGVILSGYGPLWLGAAHSVSAAGMIATMSGVILLICGVAGPCRRGAGQGV
ncbi:metal ABC transporter permease [Paracoccus sp. (in: a-proteobacteria)]|uniref:metal ABC transporter permease n=1 Tax=Paracoccus sp. TaxID=267 RepID=UPI0026DEEC7E|nr:metal ABC transporter permease [Paracoccus sp. (in: a-proteobacteria)]MDO5648006.1 metal ABC transporter permease [Paracoccus sp. (in: a-proteobacteria)]